MAHAVVRTDKMFGTDNRTGIVSAKYMGSGSTPTAIDNGNVVLIGGLLDDGATPPVYEREIYSATTPAANSDINKIVLVATPEMEYCQLNYAIDKFENKAGAPLRGYFLTPNAIFSVTKDALDGKATPAIGDLVELKAGTKLNVVASATANSTQVGKIIAIDTVGRFTYYVIQVK